MEKYMHADSCNGHSFISDAVLCADTRDMWTQNVQLKVNHTVMALK
jgi:hypothetical protein